MTSLLFYYDRKLPSNFYVYLDAIQPLYRYRDAIKDTFVRDVSMIFAHCEMRCATRRSRSLYNDRFLIGQIIEYFRGVARFCQNS